MNHVDRVDLLQFLIDEGVFPMTLANKGVPMTDAKAKSRIEADDRAIAIYHVIYKNEGFDVATQALFHLVQKAARNWPGKKRMLILDIEGHRNSGGRFDADMLELQEHFLPEVLGPFVTDIHCPLFRATGKECQSDDVPPALILQEEPSDTG